MLGLGNYVMRFLLRGAKEHRIRNKSKPFTFPLPNALSRCAEP